VHNDPWIKSNLQFYFCQTEKNYFMDLMGACETGQPPFITFFTQTHNAHVKPGILFRLCPSFSLGFPVKCIGSRGHGLALLLEKIVNGFF
jgi:hypothetical protein